MDIAVFHSLPAFYHFSMPATSWLAHASGAIAGYQRSLTITLP
jgi:hypothetical protein